MVGLSGDQKKSLHVLAYMMFRMGQEERARRIYAALVSLAPEDRPDRTALTGLAAIAIGRGDGAGALEHLRAAMEGAALSSRRAALLLMKAQALWLEGRVAEAQAARDEFLFLSDRSARGNDA
jgi:hypothetical protein